MTLIRFWSLRHAPNPNFLEEVRLFQRASRDLTIPLEATLLSRTTCDPSQQEKGIQEEWIRASEMPVEEKRIQAPKKLRHLVWCGSFSARRRMSTMLPEPRMKLVRASWLQISLIQIAYRVSPDNLDWVSAEPQQPLACEDRGDVELAERRVGHQSVPVAIAGRSLLSVYRTLEPVPLSRCYVALVEILAVPLGVQSHTGLLESPLVSGTLDALRESLNASWRNMVVPSHEGVVVLESLDLDGGNLAENRLAGPRLSTELPNLLVFSVLIKLSILVSARPCCKCRFRSGLITR